MSDKCFCHLNGYEVKDAKARKSIEEMQANIEEMQANIENNTSSSTNAIDALQAEIENETTLRENADAEIMNVVNEMKKKYGFFVTPQMFGAKGDGVTNDASAFQQAFDTGYDVFIPSANNENYLLTSSVSASTISQTIFAIPSNGTKSRITLDNGAEIQLKHENIRLIGLTIVSKTGVFGTGVGTAIRIRGNQENGASDCIIENCRFGYFSTAIYNDGRGLRVQYCRFAGNNYCVNQNYNFDGEGLQKLEEGNRAFRFENNRLHLLTYGVWNHTGILRGAVISGNIVDVGSCLLLSNADIIESIISNNTINLNTRSALKLADGNYEGLIIDGNIFEGRATGGASYAIEINGATSFKGNTISNNRFKDIARDAIITTCAWERNIVCGNNFDNIASQKTSNSDGCIEFASMSNCVIANNVFNQQTTLSALRGTQTSASVTGCKINNNVYSASDIISSYTDGGGNSIQTS